MFGDFKQIKAYFSKIDSFDELLIIQQNRGVGKAEMIKEFKRIVAKNPDEIFDLKPELWINVGIDNPTKLLKYCNGKKRNSLIEGMFKITN